MNVTSFALDRRGNIINSTATSHVKLSEAVAYKTSNPDSITFVRDCDKETHRKACEFLAQSGLTLHSTKTQNVFVLGNVVKPKIACEIA